MLFNIINAPEPYILRAVDLEVAAIAISAIGEGLLGLEEIGGDRSGVVPLFTVRGAADAWFAKQFGRNFGDSLNHVLGIDDRYEEVVRALHSVFIGTPADKLAFDELAAKCPDDEAYVALLLSTHDAKRTSDHDIGRQAWDMALRMVEGRLARNVAMAEAVEEAAGATKQ